MNISSSWVAESTLLLWPRTRVETAAEMPAARPLTSRTGRRTAALHRAGNIFDLIDGRLHGMIHLLQTGAGAVTRVVEKVAHPFHLFAPGMHDREGFVGDVRDLRACFLHDLVGGEGHLIDALDKLPGAFRKDRGLLDESLHGRNHFCGCITHGIEGRSDLFDHRTDLIEHWFHLDQHGLDTFHEPGGLVLDLPGHAIQREHDAGLHHEGQAGEQHCDRHHDPKGIFRHTR